MKKIGLVGFIIFIAILFFQFDLDQYLTLEYIKAQQAQIDRFYTENRVLSIVVYFLIYVATTALSLRARPY